MRRSPNSVSYTHLDVYKRQYYMNTYEDPVIRSFAMSDFDMDSSELITAD